MTGVLGLPTEAQRLAALHAFGILDTPKDPAFDYVVETAAALYDTPIAALSLLDRDRQWFKAEIGLGVRQSARAGSFCDQTIAAPSGVLLVPDAKTDARFRANPLVLGNPGIRFYAGVALHSAEGLNLGALCVIGDEPRHIEETMLDKLVLLARLAVSELELFKARHHIAQQQELREDAVLDLPMTGAVPKRVRIRNRQ